jgi:hypothetical protein
VPPFESNVTEYVFGVYIALMSMSDVMFSSGDDHSENVYPVLFGSSMLAFPFSMTF